MILNQSKTIVNMEKYPLYSYKTGVKNEKLVKKKSYIFFKINIRLREGRLKTPFLSMYSF